MTLISVTCTFSFQAYKTVTATATIGFVAGQPVQAGMMTLPSDRWNQMYPG